MFHSRDVHLIAVLQLQAELRVLAAGQADLLARPLSLALVLLPHRLPLPGQPHHLTGVHQTETKCVADVVAGAVTPPVVALEVCSLGRPHNDVLDVSPGEAGGGLEDQGDDASGHGRGGGGPSFKHSQSYFYSYLGRTFIETTVAAILMVIS